MADETDENVSGAAPPETPPQIDLGRVCSGLAFHSRNELKDWLNQEAEFWKWTDDNEIAQLGGTVRNSTYTAIREAASLADPGNYQKKSDAEVVTFVEDLFLNRRIPISESPAGREFGLWAKRDPEGCAAGLQAWFGDAVILKQNHNRHSVLSTPTVGNWIRGWLMRHGLPDVGIGTQVSIADLRRGFEEELADQKLALGTNLAEFERIRGEIAAESARFAQYHQEADRELKDLLGTFVNKMHEHEEYYEKELATRSAVTYWNEREKEHEKKATEWFSICLSLLSVGVVLLCLYWSGTLQAQVVAASQPDGDSGSATHAAVTVARDWLGSLTRVGLAVACVVWPLRLSVRNYLSHVHLALDASERAVIIKTYLALLNDDSLKDQPEVRSAMLKPMIESIFRHSSDGIVKDDLMPWQPAMELLKQVPRT